MLILRSGSSGRVGVASKKGADAIDCSDMTLACQAECAGTQEMWWSRPLSLNSVLPSADADVDEDGDDGDGGDQVCGT